MTIDEVIHDARQAGWNVSTYNVNRYGGPSERLIYFSRETGRKYSRKHYEENKAAYLARASERNKREYYEKKEIVKRLKSQPCMDCGREYPWYCMEFDHRNPSEKRAAVSTLVLESTGMPRFMAEVAKCDVVCANCHCARTHLRREAGWVDDSTKEAG